MKDHKDLILEPTGTNIIQTLDQATFELLFRSEFKGLCFFAQKYVKDFETAREIVQEAFLSLWEKRDTIDASRPVKSYLATIIHHKCHNHLRDNKKFDTGLLDIENLLEFRDVATLDILVEEELANAIQLALAELPEKCREIFILNRYENLKYHEIADKLQLSQKTVEAQMSKALQHFRVRLAEYLPLILVLMILESWERWR
ncbi:MAG: RNA polymerase sigma-70 factor [Bacteroidetes bacterium]|nr:RNA polymerase sigma-70 factor [Bacteroidota bacterium]